MGMPEPSAFIQEYFRLRDDGYGLDVDNGWLALENTNTTIATGIAFRARMKVRETLGGNLETGFKIQCRHPEGSNVWVDANVATVGASGTQTPVFVFLSDQYADEDAINIRRLTNVSTFVAGEGDETDGSTSIYLLTSQETEFEFSLRIHAWYDYSSQEYQVQAGDTIELRVVEANGTVFAGTYVNPSITVAETDYFVDGTFCETPNNVGPYCDSNGNLYIFLECSESYSIIMCLKSTDGGKTWRQQLTGRKAQGDMEGYDVKQVSADNVLHIAHGFADADYGQLNTSDHGTPDEWVIDEEISSGGGVEHTAHTTQKTALVVRGSGTYTVIAFYVDDVPPANVMYKIRSTGGSWGSAVDLDTEATNVFLSPCAVWDGSYTHVFYKDDTNGILYHNTISSSDVKGTRQSVATGLDTGLDDDDSPASNCFYYDDGGVAVIGIMYQKTAAGVAYTRYLREDTETPGKYDLQAETTATDSGVLTDPGATTANQPSMNTAIDGKVVHSLYVRNSDGDIWRGENNDEGGWGTDVAEWTGITAHYLSCNVFTHSAGNGGAKVLGYIWGGGGGGSGHLWYGEHEISAAAARRVFITHM